MSPELRRKTGLSENNRPALPVRSPEHSSEIAAVTGLICQQFHSENAQLRPSWRSERDSNCWYDLPLPKRTSITIESLRRAWHRRFYAAAFLLPLPRTQSSVASRPSNIAKIFRRRMVANCPSASTRTGMISFLEPWQSPSPKGPWFPHAAGLRTSGVPPEAQEVSHR